ncbi:MAG TPA: Ig-like domain-containing protein, partial [Longimicrobium sp.]
MIPRSKRLQRRAALCALLVALGACRDQPNPVAPEGGTPGAPGQPGVPGRPVTVQTLDCIGNRETGKVECAVARPEGGAAANITVGYQGVYVTLTSSNPSYNSGTGQFTFDVTVRNLIPQKMGTTDGTTVDPGGVRVFFHSGPSVTSGSGTAAVVPDGFGSFTGSGQAFYQYNQILANGVTSAPKQWTLVMPPTVTTFAFTLLVSAPVQYPDGYVELNGALPGTDAGPLRPGDDRALTAVVKDAFGNTVAGEPVTFGTSDAENAVVTPTGTVTGVRAGPVT